MTDYFHSVLLDKEKCVGCTNCIKRCPTEAIRVREGKAHIIESRCIDCGECIRVCPEHAKYAFVDKLEDLKNYKFSIAIPAPSLFGQFAGKLSIDDILSTLKLIGFDHVVEVALGADYVTEAYRRHIPKAIMKPAISSACPAVVRLIQVRFPELIPNILMIESPMEVTAKLAREEFMKKHQVASEDIGIFFITPCPAKVTATRQPVASMASGVDGVISISEVYGAIMRNYARLKEISDKTADAYLQRASAAGLYWARPGGEAFALEGITHLQVQGAMNVISVLEQVEMGKLKNIDFLECQACVGGCLGGALTVENPFIARMYLNQIGETLIERKPVCEAMYQKLENEGMSKIPGKIEARQILRMDEDFIVALRKVEQVEELLQSLPGLDCGACGAPTCRALAEDIVQGLAVRTDCTIELRNNVKKLAEQMLHLAEKLPPTLGKNRKEVKE